MVGIYKITSPTNKVYYGQTLDWDRRQNEYKCIQCKGQPKLFYSLNKHGFDSHKLEFIEECSLNQLDERETYYKIQFIERFGWSKALFCELFDKGGGPKSIETRRKIGEGNKGISKKLSPAKQKLKSQNRKETIKNKGGITWGYKITQKRSGNELPTKWVSVIQLDKELKPIKTWTSIKDAEEYFCKRKLTQQFHPDNIGACCRGKQKTAYGFVWKYS